MMSNARVLEIVEIFADLTPDQLDQIYQICTEMLCTKGTVIVKENTPSTEIYILLEGEVEIVAETNRLAGSKERRINTLERGQSFGEVALVDQGLRSATVRSLTDNCRVLEISRNDLFNLMKENTEIGFKIMYNLAADICLKFRQASYQFR